MSIKWSIYFSKHSCETRDHLVENYITLVLILLKILVLSFAAELEEPKIGI